jgi:hypothetical protein
MVKPIENQAIDAVCAATMILNKPCNRAQHEEIVQSLQKERFSLEQIVNQINQYELSSRVSGTTAVGQALRKLLGI